MPQVSSKKKDKIAEQITHFLFESSPDSKFTSEIAESIALDEEFTKAILQDLEKKKIIVSIDKNPNGKKCGLALFLGNVNVAERFGDCHVLGEKV